MEKIFQRFVLDTGKMEKELGQEKSSGPNFLEAGKRLVQTLRDKGYNVLISVGRNCGLPISLIVAVENAAQKITLMPDFLTTIARLDLRRYIAAEVYSS